MQEHPRPLCEQALRHLCRLRPRSFRHFPSGSQAETVCSGYAVFMGRATVHEGSLAPLTIPKRGRAREVIVNLCEDSMSTHWYDTTSRRERAAQLPPRSMLIRIEKQRSSS